MIIRDRVWLAKGNLNGLYRAIRLYASNRSFRPIGAITNHLFRKVLRKPAPLHMTVALTYQCGLRCVHCYADSPRTEDRRELTTEEIKSVIRQARRMGLLQIIFSGGEPLMREDITELIRYARSLGLITRANTNGWLLDKYYVAKLKEAGLAQCGVSIDDADPDEHDRLRGLPGSYQKALEGIHNLQEAGIHCQILTYASKRNVYGGLDKIIAMGKELGILSVYVFFPVAIGRWDGKFDVVLTQEEKEKIWSLQDLTFVHVELTSPLYQCCAITKTLIYVTPCGDIAPCPFTPYYAGNVKDESLEQIWLRHSLRINMDYPGACPLNDLQVRETLKNQIIT
jgi:MoaA/NifB/PqqE/SkfB family radical SAM enzyme